MKSQKRIKLLETSGQRWKRARFLVSFHLLCYVQPSFNVMKCFPYVSRNSSSVLVLLAHSHFSFLVQHLKMCSWLVVSNLNATQMKSLIKSQTSPCFSNRRNSSCLWILFVWYVLSVSGYPSIPRSSRILCWGSCWPSSQLPSAPPGLRGSSQPSSGSCWPARIIFSISGRSVCWTGFKENLF